MNSKPLFFTLLAIIVVAYAAIGTLYAVYTPAWQVPDEPAHYNYVRQLAEGQGMPVMEMGDYDQDYLIRLTTEGFPPELDLDSVQYEDHQPPLYYLLATPVYLLFDGALVPLRLLSVVFGAGLLIAVAGTVRTIFPARPGLALAATAFVAFIPQHVAMTAGVNNDALGELVLAVTLWALVVYVGKDLSRPWPIGHLLPAGLLAAALLAKGSAYIAVPLAVAAVAIRWRMEQRPWRWAVAQLAWLLIPALVLSAPWFVRNSVIYGWPDLTGQGRHDRVVEGQLTTGAFLAEHGWAKLAGDLVRTTFNSFWGQFGWMAVPLQARFYQGFLLFTLVAAGGFLWWVFDRRRSRLSSQQRGSLLLLLASCILTMLLFGWYNSKFVQHQGRYLFPALVPIGTAVALGLEQLTDLWPKKARCGALILVFTGMALFSVYCLFKVVVPFLGNGV